MFTRAFWAATTERAISTVAQTSVTLIGSELVGFTDLDWVQIASVSGVAGLLSVLKAIAAGRTDGNPSATNAETTGYTGTHRED